MILNYFKSHRPALIWGTSGLFLTLVFICFYPQYLLTHTMSWVCLLTFPFSIVKATGKKYNLPILIGLLWAVTMLLPTTTGVYCLLCLVLLFLVQYIIGQVHVITLIHLLLASPVFNFLSTIVSFPVRLKLSQLVVFLLSNAGYNIRAEGNLIFLNGDSFLVDQACSGMYMLGYSLLFGTMILAYFSKIGRVGIGRLILYYLVLIGLIMVGNVTRICVLILFGILPDNFLHETLGLVIYILQILGPFAFIIYYTVKSNTSTYSFDFNLPKFPLKRYALLTVLLLAAIGRNEWRPDMKHMSAQFTGKNFTTEELGSGVTKQLNDKVLVYIKPPVLPFRSDHNPMICWRGSGYSFKKVEQHQVNTSDINLAELEKGTDKLYTAWWYESSKTQTGSQYQWRRHALLNDQYFFLVNVTCNSKEELLTTIENLLTQKISINS